mmetsp:Transcript_29011/g.85835  ORF Transcript_29011/g.85835 Transcript_29011/m.85835 type:complete len:160 (+) Transcript_29011:59-538(+)
MCARGRKHTYPLNTLPIVLPPAVELPHLFVRFCLALPPRVMRDMGLVRSPRTADFIHRKQIHTSSWVVDEYVSFLDIQSFDFTKTLPQHVPAQPHTSLDNKHLQSVLQASRCLQEWVYAPQRFRGETDKERHQILRYLERKHTDHETDCRFAFKNRCMN